MNCARNCKVICSKLGIVIYDLSFWDEGKNLALQTQSMQEGLGNRTEGNHSQFKAITCIVL